MPINTLRYRTAWFKFIRRSLRLLKIARQITHDDPRRRDKLHLLNMMMEQTLHEWHLAKGRINA